MSARGHKRTLIGYTGNKRSSADGTVLFQTRLRSSFRAAHGLCLLCRNYEADIERTANGPVARAHWRCGLAHVSKTVLVYFCLYVSLSIVLRSGSCVFAGTAISRTVNLIGRV